MIFDQPKKGIGLGPKARQLENRFAPLMLVLTLLVVPSVLLELSSEPSLQKVGYILNWVIWTGFIVEAALLIIFSKRRSAYLKTHTLEIAIIILTFPFLPLSAELARTLRLLRLLRLLKLPRTLRNMFSISHVAETGFIILTALVVGTITLDVLEPSLDNPIDSLWAAFNLATTGELPDTLSRTAYIPAVGLILVGLIFVSYFTAIIAAWVIKEEQDDEWREERIREEKILAGQEKILKELAEIKLRLDRDDKTKRGNL